MNAPGVILISLYLLSNFASISLWQTVYFPCYLWRINSTNNALDNLKYDVLCRHKEDIFILPSRTKRDPETIVVTVKFAPMFFEVDEEEEFLTISGWIEIFWVDNELKWQPSKYESINEFSCNIEEIWMPQIVKFNSRNYNRFIEQMDKHRFEDAVLKSNGSVSVRSASSMYALCEYDSQSWPFEEWTCEFTLARSPNNNVLIKPFDSRTDVDSSLMKENNIWKIVSNPKFIRVEKPNFPGVILSVKLQRHESHYQNIFVYPGIALLSLSLISFWLTDQIYCRMAINMLTTLVQLTLLQRMVILMENNGSRRVPLCNFYVDSMFTSFIGLLFAAASVKLISKITDPPKYVFEILDMASAVPYAGPVLSYLIRGNNDGASTIKDDEIGLTTEVHTKKNQKWMTISKVLDKCAFLLIVFYFFVFYGLRLLI